MNVIWFRRGLRFHDNPALLSTIENDKKFLAVYIYDTTFQDTTFRPYHNNCFLLECLQDLDNRLKQVGSMLHIFYGCPLAIFRHIHFLHPIEKVCLQQDPEPIWHSRDDAVKSLCIELDIKWDEHVSHNLWNPLEIIKANGGTPPFTYVMFEHVAQSIGNPTKPVEDPSWDGKSIHFIKLESVESKDFKLFSRFPTLNDVQVPDRQGETRNKRRVFGGEANALRDLEFRLETEKIAFQRGYYRPNQLRPDILGPPLSLSAALSVGCLSVRLFYWKINEIYFSINQKLPPVDVPITGQLIWREFFYVMARLNPNYDKTLNNPACLPVPWDDNDDLFNKWTEGQTGYPFIDAALRQLYQEGWIHHTARNAVAMFLTRGDLWLRWDKGAEHMAYQLVDTDWAVNSGNWMWVCNSAFQKLLDSSHCIDSVQFGRRLEPSGDYIRKFVPELAGFEYEYIHEPWKAPLEVQQAAKCILGRDYPERMVIHEEVWPRNQLRMQSFRNDIMERSNCMPPPHVHPSSDSEVYRLFCMMEKSLASKT